MVTFCKPKDRENPWVVFSFQKGFEMVQHLVQKILHCFQKKDAKFDPFIRILGWRKQSIKKRPKLTKCVCNMATETCSSSLNHPSYPKKTQRVGSVLYVRQPKISFHWLVFMSVFVCFLGDSSPPIASLTCLLSSHLFFQQNDFGIVTFFRTPTICSLEFLIRNVHSKFQSPIYFLWRKNVTIFPFLDVPFFSQSFPSNESNWNANHDAFVGIRFY